MNETRDWRWSPRKDHIELYVVATDTVIDMGEASIGGMVSVTHRLNALEATIAAQAARIEALTKALRLLDGLDPSQFFDMDEMANEAHRISSPALRQGQPASEGEV